MSVRLPLGRYSKLLPNLTNWSVLQRGNHGICRSRLSIPGTTQQNFNVISTTLKRSIHEIKPNNEVASTSTTVPASTLSWVDSDLVPAKIRPYLQLARVDKSVGTYLLLWPCCWGAALAAPIGSFPDPWLMTKFAIGAFVMRGAGTCIFLS